MRTAIATSSALQSLDTKPEAPAVRAACGEIHPMPEISSIRVSGDTPRIASQSSAPERSPRNRSTRATSGCRRPGHVERLLGIGGDHAPVDPALAAEQDLEPPLDDGVVVDDQNPQRCLGHLRTLRRERR